MAPRPAKRPAPYYPESELSFFLISKIPNLAEDDDIIVDLSCDSGEADTVVARGLANLLVWLSVINAAAIKLYFPPEEAGTSLVFSVDPRIDFGAFVGDHENYDKKTVCTTVVKLKFTLESELLEAGKLVDVFTNSPLVIDCVYFKGSESFPAWPSRG